MKNAKEQIKANNKKARHDYFIEEVYEAGIALSGTEVKSIRQGKVSIKEAYCTIRNGEIYVQGLHISPYDHGNINNLDPLRDRKLLLHKREIRKLEQAKKEKGYTIVPLKIAIRDSLVKVDVALAKGKHNYDKRESLKAKDDKRRINQAMKNFI